MHTKFEKIAIIGKYMNQSALELMRSDLTDLAKHLTSANIEVWIEKNTAEYVDVAGFKTESLTPLILPVP